MSVQEPEQGAFLLLARACSPSTTSQPPSSPGSIPWPGLYCPLRVTLLADLGSRFLPEGSWRCQLGQACLGEKQVWGGVQVIQAQPGADTVPKAGL